ncbi:hypothetical protein GALMADRAFT_109196 [Galerina marginata CBS 339.88]|uniref:Fork-head domain-containing protein n=1 Tax=Galerina marginata (strain CBS 339.88) TaxID=685588 RepID=A0A067U2X1_GALM3|nr:hypothetical protein GALMADRAFT_109196 [Galerina marginata CBS 339.88]
MSHLHSILNPESIRIHGETSSVETEFLDNQSSSAEDDISPPASDDEIDELDEESEEDDYDDPSPPPTLRLVALQSDESPQLSPQDGRDAIKADPKEDRALTRREEKRPENVKEPVPRRRLEKHDRKIDLGLHDHKAHADCPDTLACLPDTHGRPQHTLPVILRCAILGSPRKRLTIREIYATMESKYPYYKTAGQTWKQSVRHHLSLNRLFERQPRPVTDPGFGSYWTVNLAAPPGTKRPRKRGRPNKDTVESSTTKRVSASKTQDSPTSQSHPGPTKFQFQPQTHPPPPPPPLPHPQVNTLSPQSPITLQSPPQPVPQSQHQGRPQHQIQDHPPHHVMTTHKSQFQAHIQPIEHLPPQQQSYISQSQGQLKSPGQIHSLRQQEMQRFGQDHHRKPLTPVTPLSGRDSAYPPSSKDSETEDGGPITHEDDTNGPTVSDDEFESEEEMIPHYGRRQTHSGAFIPTRPSPIFSLPPFSALDQNREDVVEHMRQEIATLRRTSAEAVSTSLRLSEQLANANLEVSRSREAVRDLEDMLQNEASKRKDAERIKDQEIERRRAAEHALGSLAARARPT